jgi:hypothetical protein
MNQIFRWLETWFGTFKAATTTAKPNFKNGFQVNGSDYSATELNTALGGGDPGTAGTVTASKVVIVDSNKDISVFRNVGVVNLDAGSSGVVGTVDVFPTTASKGKLQIAAADSAGNTTTTITNASQAAARTYTVPDAGTNASFVMTAGAQSIAGAKTFTTASGLQGTGNIAALRQSGVVEGSIGAESITTGGGSFSISTADNAGDTVTLVRIASQAASREYGLRDWSTKTSSDTECSLAGIKVVADTTNRPGALGCLLFATGNSKLYVCTTASATAATWTIVGTQS